MSTTTEARLSELDRVTDGLAADASLAGELFALVDVIDAQPALRRVLTDPSIAENGLSELVASVFGPRVSPRACTVLIEAASRRWGGGSGLAAALERQGVRALLSAAQAAGALDRVEEELFGFGRVVDANRPLRAALGDRNSSLEGRQQLVAELLADKADPVTVALARRAVAARLRTFDLTLAEYLQLAARLRARTIGKVVVAQPLSAEQERRLQTALSAQLGRDIALQITLDPEVLGGVRVTVGDEVIEGTVATRLAAAERQISQ